MKRPNIFTFALGSAILIATIVTLIFNYPILVATYPRLSILFILLIVFLLISFLLIEYGDFSTETAITEQIKKGKKN